MSSGPRQHPIQSLAVPVARAILASILALSFFTTIAPLGSASAGLMACCIGKPGHESGSCSSGLLQPARKAQPEPELLCGQEPAPTTARSIKTIEAEDGAHCSLHARSAGDVPADSTKQTEPEATSVKSETPGFPRIHTVSSSCSAECATSMSYTRRPRQREQSTLSSPARPRLHLTRRALTTDYPQIKTQNTKWVQLRPRAPPAHLA